MPTQHPPSDHPLAPPLLRRHCAGVPRRFGVSGLMLLVTMCAVLFALLQTLDADRGTFCVISLLFVGVAVGQVLLFGGQKPREASLAVGACLFPVEMLVLFSYLRLAPGRPLNLFPGGIVCGLPCLIPAGAVFGYLAGTLSAGIFLVRQQFDKDPEELNGPLLQLQPFTNADIDTLIDWTKSCRLFDDWAGTAFSYPLDREQVTRHLQEAHGEKTDRHAFLAVCPSTGRPLGFVELSRIPWQMRSAHIAHALIAPDASHRERLSMELLIATARVAFEEMRFHRVEAIATARDRTTRACYLGVGFREEGTLRDALAVDGHYRGACVLGILEDDRLQRPPLDGII